MTDLCPFTDTGEHFHGCPCNPPFEDDHTPDVVEDESGEDE